MAGVLCVLAFRAASATLTGGAGTACVWLQPSPSRSPMHGWWTRCRLGTSGIQGAGKRTSDQPNPRKCTPPAPETSLNLRRTRDRTSIAGAATKSATERLAGAMPSYKAQDHKRVCGGPCSCVRRGNSGGCRFGMLAR